MQNWLSIIVNAGIPVIQFLFDSDRKLFENAMAFAQQQVKQLIGKHPDFYPMYTEGGSWNHEGPIFTHWCDGFLPGMMWLFLRHGNADKSESRFWMEQAIRYSRPLEARIAEGDVHDLGFIFFSAFYRWYRLTRDNSIHELVLKAGRQLAGYFSDDGQYLRSAVTEDSIFIDVMMNVGLIFYAARELNDKKLRDIATRHCITTRRTLVRADGSTAHMKACSTRKQVNSCGKPRSRVSAAIPAGPEALTWALYGFTASYEYSRDPRFLHTAETCADYYITHTPPDGVPPWDYNAPAEHRSLIDTSAAAIAAAGLMRLCRHIADPMKGHFYWSTAIHILRTLCTKHLGAQDPQWEGVLKGGLYHLHKDLGVDESVMWGDYYFVEALEEALRIMRSHSSGAPVHTS